MVEVGERSINEVSEKTLTKDNFSLLLPDLVERSTLLMKMYRETTAIKVVVLKTCQEAQNPERMWRTLLPFYPLDSDYPSLPCQVALEYIGMLIMSCCSSG